MKRRFSSFQKALFLNIVKEGEGVTIIKSIRRIISSIQQSYIQKWSCRLITKFIVSAL